MTSKRRALRRSVIRRTGVALPDQAGNRAQRRAAEREQRKRRQEGDET
ncbi:hypothetical protein AB0939_29985 [Streptomyces sp. NPDC006990]